MRRTPLVKLRPATSPGHRPAPKSPPPSWLRSPRRVRPWDPTRPPAQRSRPLTSRTFLPLPGHECPSRSSGPPRATCQGQATSASDVAPPPPKKLIRRKPRCAQPHAWPWRKSIPPAATNTNASLACSLARSLAAPALRSHLRPGQTGHRR
ncbi:unnamed protein product [Urochloa humidicola]